MTHRKNILSACLLMVATPVCADPVIYFKEPVRPDLVQWVEDHTGTRLPPSQQLAVIDNNSPILVHTKIGQNGISFVAPAAESDGTIYVPVRTVVHLPEESYGALIVHELTHVAQRLNARRYSCPGQYEAEAYQMQNTYLLEHGEAAIMQAEQLRQLQDCSGGASEVVGTRF